MYDELNDPAERMAMAIKRKHGRSERSMVPVGKTIDISEIRAGLNPPQMHQDDAPLDGYGLYKALIARIPHSTQVSFTSEQIAALRHASEQLRWGKHKLDLRLSLPLPGKRCYLVLIGGSERRSSERRLQEGTTDLTPGKLLMLATWAAIVWVLVYVATGGLPTV